MRGSACRAAGGPFGGHRARRGSRHRWTIAPILCAILPLLALPGCARPGQRTPTPLPAVTYPHTIVALAPVELILDRVAGVWQFTVRCREPGSFDEVTVVVREPHGEASYKSALTQTRTCPSDEPPALTGRLGVPALRSDEQLTIALTVSQRSGNGLSGTTKERAYAIDAAGELHPATP